MKIGIARHHSTEAVLATYRFAQALWRFVYFNVMNPEIAERTRSVIAKHLRVPFEQVPLEATFEQLGMDSLDSVNLLFEIEDEFDISIDDREAKAIASVKQMVEGIELLLARKAAHDEAAPPTA